MPRMNLNIKFINRPIKPVAFGLMVFVTALGISSLTGSSLLGGARLGYLVAIVMLINSAGFFLGWVLSSQRIAEYSLLFAFWALLSNDIFIVQTYGWNFLWALFTLQPKAPSVWMSLGIVIIAGGSYILERADRFPRLIR